MGDKELGDKKKKIHSKQTVRQYGEILKFKHLLGRKKLLQRMESEDKFRNISTIRTS